MNPLLVDPTRTSGLRMRFSREMIRRFNRFKAELRKLVEEEDAFGLKRKSSGSGFVSNGRWEFLTSSDQLAQFRAWIEAQILSDLLGKTLTAIQDAWLEEYIKEGWKSGGGRIFDTVRKKPLWTGISPTEPRLSFFAGTRSEFLAQSFARPVSANRVKLLASRAFTDLKGVTEAMSQGISRELVDGMIRGDSPREVAKRMAAVVDNIGKKRALVIARTETVRAHNEGALDALENLGMTEVNVMVEWSTARDSKVCPKCRPLNGIVITTEEARGMLPRHPNCRCAFIPANVGESPTGQKRSRSRIEEAISKSVKAEIPPKSKRTVAQQRAKTRWKGADAKIKKTRPKSLV